MDVKIGRIPLVLFFLLVGFFAFFRLGADSLNEWDESRRLINALGMIAHADFFNYYYLQLPDYWHAKPFLNTWVVCLDFRLFGPSEFSLRMHSALASVLTFIVVYFLVKRYRSALFALFTCLCLLGSRAVMGDHLGRTGDQDAMLILFLLLSLYFALGYIDFGKRNGLLIAAIFLGLAFLSKSFVSLAYIPGLALYAVSRGKAGALLKDYRLYLAAAIYLLFVAGHYLLIREFGHDRDIMRYGGSDMWETSIQYDLVERFFKPSLESEFNPLLLFTSLDVYFSIWNYVLYLGLLVSGIVWLTRKGRKRPRFRTNRSDLLRLSVFTGIPILLVFSLPQNPKIWYFAPAYIFLGIITMDILFRLIRKKKWFIWPVSALILVALLVQFNYINSPDTALKDFFYANRHTISSAEVVVADAQTPQHHAAYLNMFSPRTRMHDLQVDDPVITDGDLFYLNEERAASFGMEILAQNGTYCLATLNTTQGAPE